MVFKQLAAMTFQDPIKDLQLDTVVPSMNDEEWYRLLGSCPVVGLGTYGDVEVSEHGQIQIGPQ